jgi:hypothetical protein
MEKILRWMNFLLNCFINTCMIVALIIVVLYFVWGITPQTVVERSSFFFSESWKIITGKSGPSEPEKPEVVTQAQVEKARQYIHYSTK